MADPKSSSRRVAQVHKQIQPQPYFSYISMLFSISFAVLLIATLGETKKILPILSSYDLMALKAAHSNESARALTYAVDFTSQKYALDCKNRFESTDTRSRAYKSSRMESLQVFWPNVASVEPAKDRALYQPASFSLQTDPFGYESDTLTEGAGFSKEMVLFDRTRSANTKWSEGQLSAFLLRPMVPSLDQLSETLSKALIKRFPLPVSPYDTTTGDEIFLFPVNSKTNYHPSKIGDPMRNWPLKSIVKWKANIFIKSAHQQRRPFTLLFFESALRKNIFPKSRSHRCLFDSQTRVLRLLKQQIDTCKEGEGFFIGATTISARGFDLPSPPQIYSFNSGCIGHQSLPGESILLHDLHEGEPYGFGQARLILLHPSMPKAIPYDNNNGIINKAPIGRGALSARLMIHLYRYAFTFEPEKL